MIETGFDVRIKTYQVIENQLPEFILSESPKAVDFFKQYFISHEFQSGPIDVAENLDQYLKLDKLVPEDSSQNISLASNITSSSETITISNVDYRGEDLGTKGFPNEYGLLKVGNEIITYTGITTNTFTGCIRGFSGITSYHSDNDQNELVFSTSEAESHSENDKVQNLSSLFLKEFYKKLKFSLTPGLENNDFSSKINAGNFIKEARTFYQAKGTDESIRILFEVLYGVKSSVTNLEDYVIKPSSAEFLRREIVIVDVISGDPNNIVGQTIRKENDPTLQASVSEVEIVKRKNKNYYKLSLFVGFNDQDLIEGNFTIFNKTKSVELVSVGSSIITVDSTVGFSTSGILISGKNTISYTDKTINQFLGCSGITDNISSTDDVKSDEVLYAYENGDLSKKVEMRITGVLSKLNSISNVLFCTEGEKIYPKSVGRIILNPQADKTVEQIFANSWIYNTSSRFYVENINVPIFTLSTTEIDKSSLKINDEIEILERDTQNILFSGATIHAFGISGGKVTVTLDNLIGFVLDNQKKYDIRRKLNKASSQNVAIDYGNDKITSDIQNVYVDVIDNNFYVASNSLPSYEITSSIIKSTISDAIKDVTIQDYNEELDVYSSIAFQNSVDFNTGDEIYYTFTNKPLRGLSEGRYFVKVVAPNNKIKLYSALSFLDTDNYLEFGLPENNASGSHSFTLYVQKEEKIGAQKLLKKFLPVSNIKNGSGQKTDPGPTGMLINGVEIINYKSSDKVYYGPLTKVSVLNSGTDYDVVNLPNIIVSNSTTGNGTTALVRPVVRGKIKDILVDPQNFDLDKIITVSITGGNGVGAYAIPSLTKRYRSVEFNAGISTIIPNGGVDINDETITFTSNHNFTNGQQVIYDSNNNDPLGIGTFKGSNTNQNQTLIEGITYFVRIVNGSTIKLHNNLSDCNLGINTIGFTTISAQGIHKFRETIASKTLNKIRIINSGSNYENRHLYVKPSGISTISNWIYFKNHGFKQGDRVLYSTKAGIGTTAVSISGLSTANEYYVLKIDDNKFRLAKSDIYYFNPNVSIASTPTQDIFLPNHNFQTNQIVQIGKEFGLNSLQVSQTQTGTSFKLPAADGNLSQSVYIIKKSDNYVSISTTPVGVGSTGLFLQSKGSDSARYYFDPQLNNTFSEDYNLKKYVKFNTSGSGFQIFKYPDIKINLNVSYGSTIVGVITATPIVRGEIVDLYLYENGTGYGSTTLNLIKRPTITVDTGNNAQLKPFVDGTGRISSVQVQFGGSNYAGPPDLIVTGDGNGAILRPVMNNGSIDSVVVINSGIGYTDLTTYVKVKQPGQNATFDSEIRSLTVNQNRFGNEILFSATNNLQYGWVGYSTNIAKNYFNDDGLKHSPIIGWAYDGNPIYGPYGYSSPNNNNSIKILETGYILSSNSVEDRPNAFSSGFFVEDYVYNGSGDLDMCNGRFSITPEFPDGVYAYFVGVTTDPATNTLFPKFPYFIGDAYRSTFIEENRTLDQSYNFNSSNLIRNTFPYKINDNYADNDFIVEPNEISNQYAVIESTTSGKVESFVINDGGQNYAIRDQILVDDENVGGGLYAEVSSVSGKEITNITTNIEQYDNVVFIRESQNQVSGYVTSFPHNLITQDYVNVSGLSTFIKGFSGSHRIGVSSEKSILVVGVSTNTQFTGVVTDIFISSIPKGISVGSSLGIGTETVSVLNIFSDDRILRVRRGLVGISSHEIGTDVVLLPNKFVIDFQTQSFDSKLNQKLYFNPIQNIGFGTIVGIATTVSYTKGYTTNILPIPTQSIYLPNHNLSTRQAVILTKPIGPAGISTSIGVSTTGIGNTFLIPESGTSQVLYVISKSKDYIGLTTQIGLTTTTNGLFFRSFVTNGGITTDSQYSIETNYNQVKGSISKIKATVSVSTYHNLVDGDFIDLNVIPSQTVGIGTSISVRVKYNNSFDKILINPIGFNSLGISTSSGVITITKHGLKTGDKVIYDADLIASGLTTAQYFIYKIDDDRINLCRYYEDSVSSPPNIISIASTGGSSQSLSLINPQLLATKGNDLFFDLSDPSLVGKKLKLFYDKEFINEFVSTGNSSIFNVVNVGTIGVAATASLTLKYTNDIPSRLYYNLQSSGFISTSDIDVKNRSEISYVDSVYNNQYSISGVGTVGIGLTTFDISLEKLPENTLYDQNNCQTLEYATTSENAKGSIKKINVLSPGLNYKKLPKVIGVASTLGFGAVISPVSNDIGQIAKVRILDQGFEYSSDKTLRPEAYISPYLGITDSNTVTNVEIISGGKNYITPPLFDLVDTVTGKRNDSGLFTAEITGSSISKVNNPVPAKGLTNNPHTLFSYNNSNGVGINSVFSSSSGIVTAYLVTPSIGFPVGSRPFAIGDKVFVEGIVGIGQTSNFNSSDNGYKFFEVIGLDYGIIPSKIEYDIRPYTYNVGLAKTNQGGSPIIVKQQNYPTFNITQDYTTFLKNESLLVKISNIFLPQDLTVQETDKDYIKVFGKYQLKSGDIVKGLTSGTIATIDESFDKIALFDTDYSLRSDYGWKNQVGKLNEDFQVIQDSDYYQNLSYSIKSPIAYDNFIDSVNRLVHPTGLKNFSDTQIINTKGATVGIDTVNTISLIDFIEEMSVDTISDFDFTIDVDVLSNKSKFIRFKNKRITDYIKCISNRVLNLDDISSRFSNKENNGTNYIDLKVLDQDYSNFLLQIKGANSNQLAIIELASIIGLDGENAFTLMKGFLSNDSNIFDGEEIGEVITYIDEYDTATLRFIPADPFEKDYDIKVFERKFNSSNAGVGTTSIGFIDLTSSISTIGVGTTVAILTTNSNNTSSVFGSLEVIPNDKDDVINIIEFYLDYNGTNVSIAEYFINTGIGTQSIRKLCSLDPNIVDGNIVLNVQNDINTDLVIKGRFVGFGSTSVGIGTYRFKDEDQDDGTEKTLNLVTNYKTISGITTFVGITSTNVSSLKSTIRVSYGETSSLHQILCINDGINIHNVEYQSLSIGSTTGIGTFGIGYVGQNLEMSFYPDLNYISGIGTFQSYTEFFYPELDTINLTQDLIYGSTVESLVPRQYDGLNGSRINRKSFQVFYQEKPVYMKTFNPQKSSVLDPVSGVFTIPNHFFSTGEELIYNPASSFINGISTSVGIGSTLSYTGIVTNILPSKVYAIKVNNDKFRLATRKEYALSPGPGIYVTFTSLGLGNAHELEMVKKMEKSIISINNIVQSPISYALVTHNLSNNGGQIGTASTIFSISGISSVSPKDLLKIDNEYFNVTSVGVGTTSYGPISGIGTITLVQVERGFVGSNVAIHTDGSPVLLYKGSFNIVKNTIHFTDAPAGSGVEEFGPSNVRNPYAYFSGRVFLRQDYATNKIYDDLSPQFNGIGQTFRVTTTGLNTSGIETGSGVLFINGIFQTPSTFNNLGRNYSFLENVGVTSVVFTGITSQNGSIVRSDSDVNLNQLPRGGLIVSLGSTGGLGIAPLVGAAVTAVVRSGIVTYTTKNFNTSPGGPNSFSDPAGIFFKPDGTKMFILSNSSKIYEFSLSTPWDVTTATFTTDLSTTGENNPQDIFFNSTGDRVFYTGDSGDDITSKTLTTAWSLAASSGASIPLSNAKIEELTINAYTLSKGLFIKSDGTRVYLLGNVSGIGYQVLQFVLTTGYDFSTVNIGLSTTYTIPSAITNPTGLSFSQSGKKMYVCNASSFYEIDLGTAWDIGTIIYRNKKYSISEDTSVQSISLNNSDKNLYLVGDTNNRIYQYDFSSSGDIVSVGLGTTDILGSGYRGTVAIGITDPNHSGLAATITATVGAGGTLSFNVVYPGSGYISPTISISAPLYENLPVVGVSRLGIGSTTSTGTGLLMNVEVGSSSTTGIGSTYFEVKSFSITRSGYQFQIGDVFKPVGLVTDRRLSSPLQDFTLTVLDVFNDRASLWQFGELDFIDSVSDLQDGSRTIFPLRYNSGLVSFETDPKDKDSLFIDLASVLIIFINGVLQVPGESYIFNGGSIVQFTQPPNADDDVDIFFYRGTRNVDTVIVDNVETIKDGDYVKILHTNTDALTIEQERRIVVGIPTADTVETTLYYGVGIDTQTYKPFSWSKQKTDRILNGNLVFKSRDTIESVVHPTARVIKDITPTSSEIFVDDAYLFNYEENESVINITDFDALLIESKDPTAGQVTATISGQQVTGLSIVNVGSGYTGATIDAKIAAPKQIGVGVGTTASATISVSSDGTLTTPITITNPGYGYTQIPQVIVPVNRVKSETIENIEVVQSFTGIITGIGTTTGSGGHPLAFKFFIKGTGISTNLGGLSVGYPLYVFNSRVGNGITSVDASDSAIVGVGTTFIDNIYYIHQISFTGDLNDVGIVTSNILSTNNIVGIATTSSSANPIATMSVGRFGNLERSQTPVSIGVAGYTISGLSTFPVFQRRAYGLRSTGGLKKDLE